jgi:TonB family protein
MPKSLRFWRNVALIGAAHVVAIVGLVRWSHESKTALSQSVVWMNGAISGGGASSLPPQKPKKIATPVPEPKEQEEQADDQPILATAKSDIQLPMPKPSATPTPSPRSTSTPRPTASPKMKVPPKSTPKPKPKPTPKPSPKKLVIAKASPKPTPTPKKKEEKEDVDLAKEVEKKTDEKPVAATDGKTLTNGNGGRAGGGGGQSQFGWYGSMLHDRFYSEWAQPTNVASTGAKKSVLVKLRIEKDGRVSNFEIVRPSGNPAIDDSVRAAAKRVTQVDPLPAGLGSGEHYDVKINFELNSE